MDMSSTDSLVLEVLQRASSQNPDILKPAEAKLKEWETQPGFYTVLFNVISNHTFDLNVRWIAVLYFKNGIDKYWRKNAPNAISEQEKSSLRIGLLSNLREPVNQIATQLAVLVSKVARIDCPKEWPELFPALLQTLENNDRIIQNRGLLTLHHVIKSLASKRLAIDRKFFQDVTENIYTFILNLWNNYTENFLREIANNSATEIITENLEKALLSLRILRKLTVHGFKKPHESRDAMCFLKVIFERAKATLECRKQLRGKGIYLLELCEKFIIHLTKILLSVLEMHPFSYIDFIQPTLEFTVFYIFTSEGSNLIYERFIIQCFNLIKGILLCNEYKPNPKRIEMTKEPETLRAYQIKMQFFQPEILGEICRKLVTHYFLLNEDDLGLWDADPETFATDEGGESWKYSLRPSMETVFVTLFHEFRNKLAPVLLELVQSTNILVSSEDLSAILRKDAIYNAVGLAAFDLFDEINFDQWFQNTLIQELKIKDTNYRIIRRRVTWLIGIWAGIKMSAELRPTLYMTILSLLQSEEDMAVRLTASSSLRHAVDDFDFNFEQFNPFLEPAFNLLFNLLKEAHECDTKMHVLNVMSLIIERVGNSIRPHSESLIQYLPHLWEASQDHNMLRCAIVSTLVQLVKALSCVNTNLYPFLIPVIQIGTNVNSEPIVYLLEDCLELWLAVLENSSTMTNELLQLFNCMPALLDYSTETLFHCLQIVKAHVLLAPEETLKLQGQAIAISLLTLFNDVIEEGVISVLKIIETCLTASPNLAVENFKAIYPRIFECIYSDKEEMTKTMTMYLVIISRVLLISFDTFTESLTRAAQNLNTTEQILLNNILDTWIDKMPCVFQPEKRKLLGLAMSTLLTSQSISVLERFNGIVINILEALNDITKPDEMGQNVDSLCITPGDFQDEVDYKTEHDNRKKQLLLSDPVYNIVLKDYFNAQMHTLKNQIGQIQFEQLLQMLDNDTKNNLRDYVTL